MVAKTVIAMALGLGLATPALAHKAGHGVSMCDVDSPYDLRIDHGKLTWLREGSAPQRIEMDRGGLMVDGQRLALSEADAQRLIEFQATVIETVPEVKAIALDAIDIAFTALEHVSRALVSTESRDHQATAERLATARIAATRHIEEGMATDQWSNAQFERLIENTVTEALPVIIGDITATALKVAFSGDEHAVQELEARAKHIEASIEAAVEDRARQLEKRADALCDSVENLKRIEAALTVRLADGRALDLVH
jgi:hypothetical protein